jgi:hypothetical protein
LSHRKSSKKVFIRGWDKISKIYLDAPAISRDEFLMRLIRTIRNTHHGYKLNKPDDLSLLSMHTGNIPDDCTGLPQYLLLCTLANPEVIIPDFVSDNEYNKLPRI